MLSNKNTQNAIFQARILSNTRLSNSFPQTLYFMATDKKKLRHSSCEKNPHSTFKLFACTDTQMQQLSI